MLLSLPGEVVVTHRRYARRAMLPAYARLDIRIAS
jgi:hypothetical protein